jgi:hypothetical protein
MYLTICDDVDWIHVAQDTVTSRNLMNSVMKNPVSLKAEYILTS